MYKSASSRRIQFCILFEKFVNDIKTHTRIQIYFVSDFIRSHTYFENLPTNTLIIESDIYYVPPPGFV